MPGTRPGMTENNSCALEQPVVVDRREERDRNLLDHIPVFDHLAVLDPENVDDLPPRGTGNHHRMHMQCHEVAFGDDTLHLYNVHLGTAFLERRYQAGRLSAIVHDRRIPQPKVVLGDFNEWMRGLATTLLTERLQSIDLRAHLRRRRTYPGVFPVLHLDHIYYDGRVEVVKLDLPRTRRALMASDHLPLVAELKIQFR